MTKDDLLYIFGSQIERYRTATNKIVMMLTDEVGSRIHVGNVDELDQLAVLLANFAYTSSDENSIPRFIHLNVNRSDDDSE
jgi:DNA-binding transcriptional regulator/RsmH inhibitor MraZ